VNISTEDIQREEKGLPEGNVLGGEDGEDELLPARL
jgi:hypothetical protein